MVSLAEFGGEIDDRDVRERVIGSRRLQKAFRQMEEILCSEQDVSADHGDRPWLVSVHRARDVIEELLAEGPSAMTVADMGDMAGDLEQHRYGHEQLATVSGDPGGLAADIGMLALRVEVPRHSIQLEQPGRVEDRRPPHGSDASHSCTARERCFATSGARCLSSAPRVTKSPRPPRNASVPAMSRSPSGVIRDPPPDSSR